MRPFAPSLLAGVTAVVVACSGDGAPLPPDWSGVSVEDVTFDVPDGWTAEADDSDGFGARRWLGPPADDGTRVGISVEVGCADRPDDDAETVLDGYLDGPQWRGHEVLARSGAAVPDAATAARSVSRYVLPVASTGDDAEITRYTVVAVEDGVVAMVLVEGATDRLPVDLPRRVRESLRFDAATEERVAACRDGSGSGTDA